ncbi:hypothetical protein IE53DRAFT_388514 [Violaceomyces palustris]|uniref:Uncharacterized protein n=1 Tax=Violaceomyces palustris TaxID=1673888 RepID=A0ACD0NU28_9BASI|nr:hypothetical protein IE53DRAFT_388514 [Violaceomyces palustris]
MDRESDEHQLLCCIVSCDPLAIVSRGFLWSGLYKPFHSPSHLPPPRPRPPPPPHTSLLHPFDRLSPLRINAARRSSTEQPGQSQFSAPLPTSLPPIPSSETAMQATYIEGCPTCAPGYELVRYEITAEGGPCSITCVPQGHWLLVLSNTTSFVVVFLSVYIVVARAALTRNRKF